MRFVFLLLLLCGSVEAHQGVHASLDHLNAQLSQQPGNITLLLQRATLQASDQHWREALADVDAASAAQTTATPAALRAEIEYRRASVLWEQAGQDKLRRRYALNDARRALASARELNPDSGPIVLLSARVAAAQGQQQQALQHYGRALQKLAPPSPDEIIEATRLAQQANQPELAKQWLEQGLSSIGPVATLIDAGIALAGNDTQRALALLARLPPASASTPARLAQRADLLERQGQRAAAQADRCNALATLQRLPQQRRELADIAALIHTLEQATAKNSCTA